MKKVQQFFLITAMMASLAACGEEGVSNSTEPLETTPQAVRETEMTTKMEETSQPVPSKENIEQTKKVQQIVYDVKNPENTFEFMEKNDIDNKHENSSYYIEIKGQVTKDIEDTLAILNEEFESLKEEVGSYKAYAKNVDKVNAFYERVLNESLCLCSRMCEYSIDFVEAIITSEKNADDMYDDCEIIYDCIYDNAGDEIYDGIYDGLLDDMYNTFYSGVLEERDDSVKYAEWSDIRSGEYKRWSDARSECYQQWSDMRSEVYKFWSDMRSELWSDDISGAKGKIEDFREEIQKMTSEIEVETVESSSAAETDVIDANDASNNSQTTDGLRPEFKEAMDAYETFYGEYCEFMKKYSQNPADLKLLTDYGEMLTKAEKVDEAFEAWNDEELTDEELKYYLDVNNPVMKMMVDVVG